MTRAEKLVVKQVKAQLLTCERPEWARLEVNVADLRAVLRLAERAEELDTVARLVKQYGAHEHVTNYLAACAALAPRTKRRKGAR
jgi:hypothetical protein